MKKWDYKGKGNELLEHEDTLKKYFRGHPPRSIAQARAAIEAIGGITRNPTQVGVFLKRLGMQIRKMGFVPLFLPSYSPNLNLIERFWKIVKKDCFYSKCYHGFGEFRAAISTCVETAHHTNRRKLKSLLSWNFQLFSTTEIFTA